MISTAMVVAALAIAGWRAADQYLQARQCAPLSPVTDRGPVDVEDYQRANEDLARRLPLYSDAAIDRIEVHPSTRCSEGEGDIVAVTSIAHVQLKEPADKCVVVEYVENALVADGWTLEATETEVAGGGARWTNAARDSARVSFSINPAPNEYVYFVDHDAPGSPIDHSDFEFPCA